MNCNFQLKLTWLKSNMITDAVFFDGFDDQVQSTTCSSVSDVPTHLGHLNEMELFLGPFLSCNQIWPSCKGALEKWVRLLLNVHTIALNNWISCWWKSCPVFLDLRIISLYNIITTPSYFLPKKQHNSN